jgi:zinc resistance-associated protein
MWKPTVLVAAALAVAGSSIVYAQEHFTAPDRDGPRIEHRHRLSPEDRAAFVDARIAALKAGLELTPEQAKNWPDFEKALRDRAQLRAERIAAREAVEQNPDIAPSAPFDRLAQRAGNMAKRSAALKRIAETGKPLYDSLSDPQKARFKNLRACYGHIIIACTLGTGMMALLIKARGCSALKGAERNATWPASLCYQQQVEPLAAE